jgi:hypothetical protein
VITRYRVAGFAIPTGTFVSAQKRFGGSASFDRLGCRLEVPKLGLRFDFFSPGGGTPTGCTMLVEVSVSARGWRTRNGLAVGDSLATLRRLYPKAVDAGLRKPPFGVRNWCADWWLTPIYGHAFHYIVTACVTPRGVAALAASGIGH